MDFNKVYVKRVVVEFDMFFCKSLVEEIIFRDKL